MKRSLRSKAPPRPRAMGNARPEQDPRRDAKPRGERMTPATSPGEISRADVRRPASPSFSTSRPDIRTITADPEKRRSPSRRDACRPGFSCYPGNRPHRSNRKILEATSPQIAGPNQHHDAIDDRRILHGTEHIHDILLGEAAYAQHLRCGHTPEQAGITHRQAHRDIISPGRSHISVPALLCRMTHHGRLIPPRFYLAPAPERLFKWLCS